MRRRPGSRPTLGAISPGRPFTLVGRAGPIARADGRGDAIDWKRVEALRPYGGIRVEDNVVAQSGGPRNLTREAFAASA